MVCAVLFRLFGTVGLFNKLQTQKIINIHGHHDGHGFSVSLSGISLRKLLKETHALYSNY